MFLLFFRVRIFLWIGCYFFLFSLEAQPTKEKEMVIEIENVLSFTRVPTVVSYSVALKSKVILRNDSGKTLIPVYVPKQKKLYWIDTFAPGKNRYTLISSPIAEEIALAWNIHQEKEKGTFLLGGQRVHRESLQIENGLLRLQIVNDADLRSKVEIRALTGDYRLVLSPLGMSQGCLEKAEHAEVLNQSIAKGIDTDPQLFSVYSGVVTHIQIQEENPFQKRILVKCLSPGLKNNGQKIFLFSRTDYEILLTWQSPVISIACFRTLKKKYYNHNGVNLNEIYIQQFPLQIQTLEAEKPQEITLPEHIEYRLIELKELMSFQDIFGKTILYQPDFLKLAVRDPIVAVIRDRMMTLISHSWHQGWKPIEQKPGEYNDIFYLVCDIQKSPNNLQDWLLELTNPLKIR